MLMTTSILKQLKVDMSIGHDFMFYALNVDSISGISDLVGYFRNKVGNRFL